MKSPLLTYCSTAVLLASLAWTASATETSSSIRGTVSDRQGNPISNSHVVVRNESTGLTRTVSTNAAGQFSLRNLPVGGEYTVIVSSPGYADTKTESLALNLGDTADLNFNLTDAGQIEEVRVVGSASVASMLALGPNATFDLDTLQTAPAINRNITDVVRADPRIYVDESRSDVNAIQCGGKNSRFNSLTLDGVRMNDAFGLNANGYPTERMPFSYDAIQQVAVEMAPFDVVYGGFTACNINAVTKSGGNEFSGGLFYDYTSDDFRGDTLEGDDIETGDYSEDRYGIHVGGPIIQDKLFFFAAYEKLEGANLFDRGPVGSGAVNEVNVSQAELDEIAEIARTLYQYDPGAIPGSLDHEDEKLLLKLDWNLADTQRLSFTYNYNDGYNWSESDSANDEFEFSNHLYERGAELNSYVGTLYSDWTDRFSTELRVGYLELDNRQNSVGGTDFGEMQVILDDVTVYLGADDSRHSNKLKYDITNFSLKGYYDLEGHNLTFGVEREALDIFNLFVQHSETEIRFRGIDNFRDGLASAIYYNNAPSQNPEDAAANWGYELNSVYGQDEFRLGDRLTLVAGLRYDWYTTDDEPALNQDFLADYGFGNDHTLDGEGLLQPRFGFTFDFTDNVTVRGGAGLYSGGNPNVWLSNNYSANNVLQFGQRGRAFGYTDGSRSLFDSDVVYEGLEDGVPNGPGWGIPQELYDAVAGGTGDNFEINYLDPDFEIPSEWKFALGATYYLDSGLVVNADLLYTQGEDSPMVLRGDLEQEGFSDQGYPVYDSVREPSFVLTNSDEGNRSLLAAFSLSQEYDNGISWAAGYAYSDAEDVQPMTSSVAFSNYTNRAFFDPQEDKLSTSDYNIAHRFTATLNYEHAFWGDNLTRVSLYGSANEGATYSIAVDGNSIYNFTPFLEGNPVLPAGEERNEHTASWWTKVDLRIEQEIPGFYAGSKASAFLVVDNLTNLLNDDWGILEDVNFPATAEPGEQAEFRVGDASRYEIRVGLSYQF